VFSYTRRVKRLGILGGTFDPVHVAHIAAATAARDALELDLVLMVVARDPWQKRGRVCAPADARFDMVAAAVEGIDGLAASRIELDRPGPTYTVDTVEALRHEDSDRELFLIIGGDVAAGLDSWHRAADLRDAVAVAMVDRDGSVGAPPQGWRAVSVHMPRLDVSSTEIRRRIAAGDSVDGLLPPAAERVLRARALYTGRQ
jgi:nicotinate-nucleotide adenylyltransferase